MTSRPGSRPAWADRSRPDGVRLRSLESIIHINLNRLRWATTEDEADYILSQLEPQFMTLAQLDPHHPLFNYYAHKGRSLDVGATLRATHPSIRVID